jgi:hypothetical protein
MDSAASVQYITLEEENRQLLTVQHTAYPQKNKTVNFYQCAAAYPLESISWLLKSLKIPSPSEEESANY